MTEDSKRPESLEEFQAKFLRDAIASTAAGLRRLADEVERETSQVDRVLEGRAASYAGVANSVLHALMWGMANLHVDRIAQYAGDADAQRVKARTAEQIAVEIETTIGGYPDNGVERPKVERGGFLNDAQWAAQIARSRREG